MRLIDADSLKDYIDCGHLRPPTELCFSELDVCNMIDKRPTIDAVEVVRCKDCKHSHMTYDGLCKYCDEWDEDGEALYLEGDFYCAWGERREDGE